MQSLTPPPPLRGPKCLRGPNHRTSQCREMGGRRGRWKILVPRLKGLGQPVIPCVHTQRAQFFPGISLGRHEGRICAAASIFPPPNGDDWGQVSFVAH